LQARTILSVGLADSIHPLRQQQLDLKKILEEKPS
jgi:hypothetical protein